MSCCFGNNTNGTEPQKSILEQSDLPLDQPIIPVTKPSDPKIEYSITVKTGDFRNSGTNGPVYINIFSRDNKQTEDLLLTAPDKPFTQSSTRKFQVYATDIGKPQRIIIRHEDKSTGWYVDYIEISVHNFLIRFVANRWLNQLKNDRKLDIELFGSEQPAVLYNIEIQTGDEQIEILDSPVYMQIYGTTTTTPKFFLESKNPSFKKDTLSKFSISSNNVGEIERIVIGHEGLGKVNDWYLKTLKVQMLGQQQEYVVDKWLSPTQGEQRLFVELSKEKPPSPLPAPPPPSPKYIITIQTGDVPQQETTENIEITIRGSDEQIDKILLKDYAKFNNEQLFQKGNVDEFEIDHTDIGNIESITIGFSDSQQNIAWLLESINIQYKENTYHFQSQCWLSNRLGSNFSWVTIKPDESNDDINYKVTVVTGESGIDANVILCIYGDDETTTTNLALKTTKDGSDAKFDRESTVEFDLKAVDVGKIKKINIGHDGKGSEQQWFLKSIKIEKNDELYTFTANRWLSEEKDDQKTFIDLLPDEQKPPTPVPIKDQANYIITIITSSEKDAGTDSNVLMTIFGDKDQTKQFQLINTKQGEKALFESGTTNEFEMELDDVGNVNKISIGHDGIGFQPNWNLESVQIQKGSDIYNFVAKKVLDDSATFIDLTPTSSSIKRQSIFFFSSSIVIFTGATPSSESINIKTPRSITPEQKSITIKEITYKISIQTDSYQKDIMEDNASFYMIIHGENNQTQKLYLKDGLTSDKKILFAKDEKTEFEFQTIDVGKIIKIIIGRDDSQTTDTWHVDNITIKQNDEIITFNAEQTIEPNSQIELYPSTIPKKTEITYKIILKTGPYQEEGNDSNIYLTIFGQNSQTKKIPLNKTTKINKKIIFKKDDTIEFEFKTNDVGKISKVILSQNLNEHGIRWHIDNLTIKQNNETTTFNVKRKIEKYTEIVLVPSSLRKKSETSQKLIKTSDSVSKVVVKIKGK
ncbi:unnamed protein product [Adineta steineri]|uniref:PLAT domain-containing protein n=1 Tax=Adineta steineri TaxID=433720 RepID=A0A814A3V1_9BILA|nr:unnamed protein product [Adineta steineri]CAF1047430.1 unnamed protein product [Adineta steineri]